MARFKQGAVAYIKPGAITGPEWNPVQGPSTVYPLDATVSGVSEKYIDGTLIVATDLEVTFSVFDDAPTTDGLIRIDGADRQIIKVMQIPAAGTVVAWKVIAKG
jgi:hypothetical protein